MAALNQKFMLSQHWGLADIPNRTDKQQQWPSKETMDMETKKRKADPHYGNPGAFGYKCDVSNHSQVDVLDVAVRMTFWYGNQVKNDNTKYTAVLSPLDAGSHSTFYIFNDCPTNVAGFLPDSVDITVVGESGRRIVPPYLPHRSPIEPMFMFFPSKVQWVRQTPCG
jgi:hypothetical protein